MSDLKLEESAFDASLEQPKRSILDLTLAVICFFFGILELTVAVGAAGGILSAAYHGWFDVRHLLKPAGFVIHFSPLVFLAAAATSFSGGRAALRGRLRVGVAALLICVLAVGLLMAAFKFG